MYNIDKKDNCIKRKTVKIKFDVNVNAISDVLMCLISPGSNNIPELWIKSTQTTPVDIVHKAKSIINAVAGKQKK